MEVEVAIRLLYMLGEALPASHGAHFSGDTTKTSALQDMMRTVGYLVVWPPHCCPPPTNLNISSLNPQLVSCNVSSYQHTSVSLEFFETVVRYDKFFIVEPQHIPVVLVSFCVCLSSCLIYLTVFTALFTERWHFWTNGDCETTAQRSAAGWLTSSPDLSKVCSEYNVHHQPASMKSVSVFDWWDSALFTSKHMNTFIEDILTRIQDLLELAPPVGVV